MYNSIAVNNNYFKRQDTKFCIHFVLTYTIIVYSAYKQYFTTVPLKAEDNQNLFWSGTFGIATIISKNNIRGVTVSSSPNADSSIILNKIGDQIKKIPFWCGSPTGILYYSYNCMY